MVAFQDMAILQSKEVQGVIDPSLVAITAVVVGTTMVVGAVVDTSATFPPITSDGTSYETGMCPAVRQEAEVPAREDPDRFVATINIAVVTEHFHHSKGNARVMQVTMV